MARGKAYEKPMTPTEQDKEALGEAILRVQVHELFGEHQAYDGDGYHSCYDGKWINMTNEVCAVADFITADRKRLALEARIDELDNVPWKRAEKYGVNSPYVTKKWLIERKTGLKAQQEANQ